VFAAIAAIQGVRLWPGDIMKGLSEHTVLSIFQIQAAVTMFCITPGTLAQFEKQGTFGDDHTDPSKVGVERDFASTGETREDEYEKNSIYSLLYGLYAGVGLVKDEYGTDYEFTFNTWGFSNVDDKPYGPQDPERHGKQAYHNLVQFDVLKDYLKQNPNSTWLEIGSGTAAGANLISNEIWAETIGEYNAVDMQLAGVTTCNNKWTSNNPRIKCVHANGKVLPFEDKSMDVVVVSETHIAEMEIGPEEEAIFTEMERVLKPGGIFLWGNALPTKVWGDGAVHLKGRGWSECGSIDVTERAIIARDQDVGRVDLYIEQSFARFPIFKAPYVGERCYNVSEMLLKNFYRHPGTDLYQRMVTKHDSYMQKCFMWNGKN